MRRRLATMVLATMAACTALLPAVMAAGPEDDVAAATRAWVEAYNSRDPQKILSLYSPDAVFWGTSSPTRGT